jgi:hypothetical protein
VLSALAALPARPYPAGLDTFAGCHEAYSEARQVDADYFGRTLADLTPEYVAECPDTPFLHREAMAYFWPRLLEAVYRHPDSAYAHMMYMLVFRAWAEPDRTRGVKSVLTPAEVAAAYAVLEAVRDRVTGEETAGDLVTEALDKALTATRPAPADARGDGG